MVGYILLCEENTWLRKCAVKAIGVMIMFSFLTYVVYLLPSVIGFLKTLNRIQIKYVENKNYYKN